MSVVPLFLINLNNLRIDQLLPGDRAEILGFEDDNLALLLNDMGLFLGEEIELSSVAPLGCPLCIKTDESLISLRCEYASQIVIKKVN